MSVLPGKNHVFTRISHMILFDIVESLESNNIMLIFSTIEHIYPKRSCIPLKYPLDMGGSINGGTATAGWFIVENPVKVDALGTPLVQETSI